MSFIEILSAALSMLGVYTLIIYAPYVLPRNVIPYTSTALSEVKGLLDQAEANGAITDASEYRAKLTTLANQFQRMRAESQRSPGMYQQLVLAVRSLLTYKLYTLSSQVEDMKIKVELALDERHLASLDTTQSTTQSTSTALPTPGQAKAVKKVAEPTPSPDAAPSVRGS